MNIESGEQRYLKILPISFKCKHGLFSKNLYPGFQSNSLTRWQNPLRIFIWMQNSIKFYLSLWNSTTILTLVDPWYLLVCFANKMKDLVQKNKVYENIIPVKKHEYHTRQWAATMGCTETELSDLISCLKTISISELTSATSSYLVRNWTYINLSNT